MASLFLRYGVTTVRDVGNFLAYILDVRQRERRGALQGPRIVAYGPLIDGNPTVWPSVSVMPTGVDNARTVAEHLIQNGLDGLKVYANLPADHIRAVTDVATAHGLPVAAHLSVASAREAVEAGVSSIEHVYGVLTRETPASLAELPQRLVDRGVFVSATLLLQENLTHFAAVAMPSYPHLDLVPPTIAQEWLAGQFTHGTPVFPSVLDAQGVAAYQQGVDRRTAFLQRFYDARGKITTGTDTAFPPFVIPGVSLHQEMQTLVTVGLRPLDALKAATSTAAELLRRPDLGMIAPGKLADLLLVAGNPAEDIAATQNVRLVLKGGKVVYQALPDANGA